MKITSCNCMNNIKCRDDKERNLISINMVKNKLVMAIVADDDDYYSAYLQNVKYCPFCGKEIEVKE